MPVGLSIKGAPDAVAERLRERAERHAVVEVDRSAHPFAELPSLFRF